MAAGGKGILVVVGLAAFGGLVGPKIVGPHDRPAGRPFEYTPPAHFKEAKGEGSEEAKAMFRRAWTYQGPKVAQLDRIPTINWTHTQRQGTVEPDDMTRIASGMPEMYRASDVTWKLVRVATLARKDGGRVGLIEGELEAKDGAGVRRWRSMQLAFPEDDGTAIVTASYGLSGAKEWANEVEATIDDATGVAVRLPPPPAWMAGAWAAGGAVLGAALLLWRGRASGSPAPARAKRVTPVPAAPPPRDEEEHEDEDEDDDDADDAAPDDEPEDDEDRAEDAPKAKKRAHDA